MVEGPENFDKMVELIEKKWVFSKKRTFSTMFFSERLECSSFDKLKRNFSENSRKKFAQFSEFARITSSIRNNPHSFRPDIWNAVLTTLLKLLAKVQKFSTQGSGNNGWRIFFKKSFLTIFPQGTWNAVLSSLLTLSCQKSEKFFHFLNLFICLFTIFLTYGLTDQENFLSKS